MTDTFMNPAPRVNKTDVVFSEYADGKDKSVNFALKKGEDGLIKLPTFGIQKKESAADTLSPPTIKSMARELYNKSKIKIDEETYTEMGREFTLYLVKKTFLPS